MSANKNRKVAGVMSVAAAALALAISSGATAQVTTTSTLPGSSTSSSVPASSSSTTTSSSVPTSSTTPGSSTPGSSSTTTATTTVPATMLQPKSGTADITPGEGRVLAADGTVSPVKVADSLTADGQRVVRVENVSQSLKMDILVAKTTGDTSAPSYVTPSATGGVVVTMKAGGSVRVRVLGFKPLSNVDIFMASTPTKVATVALDATGSATTDIVVPSSLTNGTHTLQIQGTDGVTSSVQAIAYGITVSGGATAGTSTTVAGGTNLPSSGPSTTMLAIVAASLLGGLGIWSRRRTA